MNGGQISPWTALPTSKPSSLQFHGLDTDKARRAILRLRKVDDFVERWAHLAISLDSASKLAQLAISLDSTSHLAQLTLSGVQVDDVDPTITIDLTGDTLTSEAAAENLTNWTLDPATGALIFGSTLSGSHTIDATAWARSYASSELDGTIHAYQWIPKDDIEGFVGTYTPPQDENYHPYSHIDLVGDGDFSPRLASAFYYEPAVGEENFHIYAKLLLDL